MTADEMRAALTAVLAEVPELDAEFVADRILPTVRGIAAGELRGIANPVELFVDYETTSDYMPVADIYRRAAALDPTS